MSVKDDFKKGCESAGNSFVEDVGGSYSCNLKSGGVIKCGTDDHCVYNPHIESGTGVLVGLTRPGIGQLVTLSPGSSTGITIDLTTAGVEELLNLRSKKDY